MKMKRRMTIISPSGSKNFSNAFYSQSNPENNYNCSFIEEKLSTENINVMIDKIKSNL
jgi:hypothetical protein